MTKRRRLILEAVLLTLGLLAMQFVEVSFRYWAIFLLGIVAYFLTAFFLREDLKKIGWLMNLPLPALYTVAVALFYFLLPEVLLSRILILVFFGFGMYAILLIENIFTISSEKTIQLLRAAQAVGFLMTLVTSFLFYDTIFSFKLPALVNALLILFISFFMILAALWSVSLSETIEKKTVQYSLVLAWFISQLAFFISFWPLTITAVSLFLVASSYVVLGIVQNHFSGKLFEKTMREYLRVGIIVLIITFFLAQWG